MQHLKSAVIALAVVAMIGLTMTVGAPTASAGGDGLVVSKSASIYELPAEGGEVVFTIGVSNIPQGASVENIVDSEFGDLIPPTDARVLSTDCAEATSQDGTYSCQFTAMVTPDGPGAHQDNVTVTIRDEGTRSATSNTVYIDFIGLTATKTAFPSTLPAAGGDVTFTFAVTNPGNVQLELVALDDDIFGDLDGQGDCSVPQLVSPGTTYSCSLTETLGAGTSDSPHINTLTATALRSFTDEVFPGEVANLRVIQEEKEYTATATAQVDFVTTGITASKTASPTSVPESGGDVTFTFGVTNTGEIDVTVDSLVDDVFGDLDGQGDCAAGETVTPGSTYTCTLTTMLSGTADQPHVNTFTANATTVDTTTLEENVASATAGHQSTASVTVNFIAAPTPEPTPTAEPTSAPVTIIRSAPLQASPPDPTAVPTPTAAPAPVTPVVTDEAVGLAHTANESRLPAALALSSITAGALILGALRRREQNN